MHLLPDPDKVRIRVYQTQLDAQVDVGACARVDDPGVGRRLPPGRGPFQEAFLTHTSTSPNLQIIASLDVARRQMELEGYELTMRMTELALRIRARRSTTIR